MSQNIDELSESVSEHFLFHEMHEKQLTELVMMLEGPHAIPAGEFLIKENELPDEIYIIQSGSFEVLKEDVVTGRQHSIAELSAGNTIGEVSLLDRGPRSASVRATEDSEVLSLNISKLLQLEDMDTENRSLSTQLKVNLAHEMGVRIRSSNTTATDLLRAELEESRLRVELAAFVGRIVLVLCFYMFALGAALSLSDQLPSTTLITVIILVVLTAVVCIGIHFSSLSASDFGLNLTNWRQSVREAILFSLPILAAVVGIKWLMVTTMSDWQGHDIFEFVSHQNVSGVALLSTLLAYNIFSPIQEFTARCGIQSPLHMFFTGKYRALIAILLSSLIFSATHLHVSVIVAAIVFPLGLFWGWLYYRVPTLLGPAISHLIIGNFALFIVGLGV